MYLTGRLLGMSEFLVFKQMYRFCLNWVSSEYLEPYMLPANGQGNISNVRSAFIRLNILSNIRTGPQEYS